MGGSKMKRLLAPAVRRDPYEVLRVSRDSSDQEIKSAYKKLALKYHPDKNADNPEASELFKEIAYSYSILSDSEKKRQYDSAGFQALDVEARNMEIDLSSLGTVDTMFVALCSKLGLPFKTTISANVLEGALSGAIRIRSLPIGTSISGKVEKQSAHFFGITINEEQAEAGIVVRVTSIAQSKFKSARHKLRQQMWARFKLKSSTSWYGERYFFHLLYGIPTHANISYVLKAAIHLIFSSCTLNQREMKALDWLCRKTVRRQLAMDKDPGAAYFKRLEGLQPCEVSRLKAGAHIFAVYGDNFFKPAMYSIEALCGKSFEDTTRKLQYIEAQILRKRNDLRQYDAEYRMSLERFRDITDKIRQETQSVDELLTRRDNIHSSFTVARLGGTGHFGNGSSSRSPGEYLRSESLVEVGSSHAKDKSTKMKWFSINLKRSNKRSRKLDTLQV